MSIRTSFNPLGTLGAVRELPYIQPVMTSETTWSNEPSFGCNVLEDDTTSYYYYKTFAAWCSMGQPPSQYVSAETRKMWIRRHSPEENYQYASWIFEKELRFEKIEFICCFSPSSYDVVGIDSNGETISLGQSSAIVGERVTITVRERKLFKTIRIGIKAPVNDPGLTELKFTAFYKP